MDEIEKMLNQYATTVHGGKNSTEYQYLSNTILNNPEIHKAFNQAIRNHKLDSIEENADGKNIFVFDDKNQKLSVDMKKFLGDTATQSYGERIVALEKRSSQQIQSIDHPIAVRKANGAIESFKKWEINNDVTPRFNTNGTQKYFDDFKPKFNFTASSSIDLDLLGGLTHDKKGDFGQSYNPELRVSVKKLGVTAGLDASGPSIDNISGGDRYLRVRLNNLATYHGVSITPGLAVTQYSGAGTALQLGLILKNENGKADIRVGGDAQLMLPSTLDTRFIIPHFLGSPVSLYAREVFNFHTGAGSSEGGVIYSFGTSSKNNGKSSAGGAHPSLTAEQIKSLPDQSSEKRSDSSASLSVQKPEALVPGNPINQGSPNFPNRALDGYKSLTLENSLNPKLMPAAGTISQPGQELPKDAKASEVQKLAAPAEAGATADQHVNGAPGHPHGAPHRDDSGTLRQGDQGRAVSELQQGLNQARYLGLDGKALAVDGKFGVNTKHAVEVFQHDRRLKEDGVAGPVTKAALEGKFKEHGQTQAAPALLINDPKHPLNAMYGQALAGLTDYNAKHNIHPSREQTQNLAAALAVKAHAQGLGVIDHVDLHNKGHVVYGVQGNPGGAHSKLVNIPTAQAIGTTVEQSSQQYAQEQKQQQAAPTQQQTQPQHNPGPVQHSLKSAGIP